jgi:hypothetical protein
MDADERLLFTASADSSLRMADLMSKIFFYIICRVVFSSIYILPTEQAHSSKQSSSFNCKYCTMKSKQLLFALGFSGLAVSVPTNITCPSNPELVCRDLVIPVTATANNTLLPTYPNSTSPTAFYEYLGSLNFSNIAPFANVVSGTFNISATYCEPTIQVDGRNAVQLLVHGAAYTKVLFPS